MENKEKKTENSQKNFSNFCCEKCDKILFVDVYLKFKDSEDGYENIAMVKVQCDCKDKYHKEYTVKEFLKIRHEKNDYCSWHPPKKEENNVNEEGEEEEQKDNGGIMTKFFCLNCQEWLCGEEEGTCLYLHNQNIGVMDNGDKNKKMKNSHKIIENYKFNMRTSCIYHDHKKAVYFCRDCHENICSICSRAFKEHRYHQVQLLNIKNEDLKNIEDSLNKIRLKVETQNDQIKEEFLKCLGNSIEEKDKEQLLKMYDKNKECNKDIISAYQNILEFYKEFCEVPNYEGVANLLKNFKYEFDLEGNRIKVNAFADENETPNELKEEQDKKNKFARFCIKTILLKDERDLIGEILFEYQREKIKRTSRTKRFFLLKKFDYYLNLIPGSLIVLKNGSFGACAGDDTIKIFSLESMEAQNEYKEASMIHRKREGILAEVDTQYFKEGGFYYCNELPDGTLVTCQATKENKNIIEFYRKEANNFSRGAYGFNNDFSQSNSNPNDQKTYITKIIPLSKAGEFNGLAISGWDGTINIYAKDKNGFTKKRKIEAHKYGVNSIIEIKEDIILSGSSNVDKTLKVWDVTKDPPKLTIDNIECSDQNSLYIVKNDYIVVGGNGVVNLFELEDFNESIESGKIPERISILSPFTGMVKSFLLLNDGSLLAGCGKDGRFGHFFIIDLKNGNPKVTLKFEHVHDDMVSSLGMLQNRYLVSSGETIKIWEIIEEEENKK